MGRRNRKVEFGLPSFARRRPLAGAAAFVVATLLALQGGTLARLQAALDAPSPATGHAEVIAQGVAEIPFDPIAWRVVRDTAEPLEIATPVERALGFVVADVEGIHVVDETAGTQARLAPGEASFVPEAAVQTRASLTDANAPYLRIALVGEADANEAGDDELVVGSAAFPAPEGRRDIDLIRDVLNADEETQVLGGDFPVLFMALSGSVEINIGDVLQEVQAGETFINAGDVTVRGLEDGSVFIAAVIGPEVPEPPRNTGTITAGVLLCPEGVAPEDLGDPVGEAAADCAPVAEGAAPTLTTPEGQELTVDEAEVVSEGRYSWVGLPFGDYVVNAPAELPAGAAESLFVDQEGNVLASGEVTIGRSFPDIHVDIYLFQAGGGSVTATVYNCPEGWTPGSDPGPCELATEGFGITLYPGSIDGTALTLDDAGFDGSSYTWSGLGLSESADVLGEGHYVIEESPLPDGYNAYTVFGGILPDGEGGSDYVNLTVDAPEAELTIYNWIEADPTGTITLDTIVCPSAESPLGECGRQFGPAGVTGVYIQDVNGAFGPFTEGNALQEGDGPFVWPDAPLAAYFMDTSNLAPPEGYEIIAVVLTPDGADVSGGFELREDLRIANIVVVLVPVGEGNEMPADSDGDGLSDDEETTYGTDAGNPDSDGDCHADGPEVGAGTDPLDAGSFPEGDCDLIESTESN